MAIALTELNQDLWFPHPEQALDEPEGLLAMGGDLSQNRLRLAYRHGIFPWYEDDQPLLWWSPPDRAVVFPDRFKPSRSLARLLNQNVFQVTLDERFDAVIAGCQQHRVQQGLGTWITQEMITAYSLLFAAGDAHCIACYSKGRLVGGLYGISVGSVFCGESMFSLESNASKVAFCHLVRTCRTLGINLIDCQMPNPHLLSLGAEVLPRTTFLRLLADFADTAVDWSQLAGPLAAWNKDARSSS